MRALPSHFSLAFLLFLPFGFLATKKSIRRTPARSFALTWQRGAFFAEATTATEAPGLVHLTDGGVLSAACAVPAAANDVATASAAESERIGTFRRI